MGENSVTNTWKALEIFQQMYGDHTILRTLVFKWHKRFKEGREEVKDDSQNGRPSTSSIEVNVKRVRQDGEWWSSFNRSNDRKSAGHKKGSIWKITTKDLGPRLWKVTRPGMLRIRLFLAEGTFTVLEKPPNSPDLASCNFFSFPQAQDYHRDPF